VADLFHAIKKRRTVGLAKAKSHPIVTNILWPKVSSKGQVFQQRRFYAPEIYRKRTAPIGLFYQGFGNLKGFESVSERQRFDVSLTSDHGMLVTIGCESAKEGCHQEPQTHPPDDLFH
jgi:hypothetical protein